MNETETPPGMDDGMEVVYTWEMDLNKSFLGAATVLVPRVSPPMTDTPDIALMPPWAHNSWVCLFATMLTIAIGGNAIVIWIVTAHPKVKAFVTQGGLQSTDEAIDAGVPLVGIPMLGDQGYNVDHYLRLGIGVKVHPLTLTAEELVDAVNTVINDKMYRENVRHLCPIFRAHTAGALQRAVAGVELVLGPGARHLRPAAADVTWTTYLMLDVLALLTAILGTSLAILICSFKIVKKLLVKKKTVKRKLN